MDGRVRLHAGLSDQYGISKSPRWLNGVGRFAILLAASVAILSQPVTAQQPAIVTYQVSFNGAPFGPLQTVTDNNPADTNPLPFFVDFFFNETDGVISVAGEMIGEGIPSLPGDPPAPGRRLRITALTASVPVGFFTPLNNPIPTVEIIACYDYSLLPVGPPYNFGSRLNGSIFNLAGPANNIDFAQVGYNSNCGCGLTRSNLFEHGRTVSIAPGPVPFDTFNNHGLITGACPRIGAYLFFKLRNDGDAISLPTSAETFASQGPSGPSVPALPPWSLVVLAVVLLSAVVLITLQRQRRPL